MVWLQTTTNYVCRPWKPDFSVQLAHPHDISFFPSLHMNKLYIERLMRFQLLVVEVQGNQNSIYI